MGDVLDLVAVTDDVNRPEGDKNPAEWVASYSGVSCRYVTEWLVVKLR